MVNNVSSEERVMPVRVPIADDDRVVRRGPSLVLGLDPEIEAVGGVGDRAEALDLARELRPDAVVMGVVMPAPAATTQILRGLAPVGEPEGSSDAGDALRRLTRRERAMLRLLGGGSSNREIAGELGVGEATVKTYVRNVLAKLGLRSWTQAALYGARHSIADRTDDSQEGAT
jgi:two-component system, NarL family, response regulator LiaR